MVKDNDPEPLLATFHSTFSHPASSLSIYITYTTIIDFTGHWNVFQAILHALVQWAGPESGRGQKSRTLCAPSTTLTPSPPKAWIRPWGTCAV
jgi:hypothetical protein